MLLMTTAFREGTGVPHVYLAGLEDGVFPATTTITSDDPPAVEEERRLAYVGKSPGPRGGSDDHLCKTAHAARRDAVIANPVSQFVGEVPGNCWITSLRYSRKTDFEEYRETPESRARFQTALYGGNYASRLPRRRTGGRKAVVKPKRTDPETKPFIA